jgi:hypothetical protein
MTETELAIDYLTAWAGRSARRPADQREVDRGLDGGGDDRPDGEDATRFGIRMDEVPEDCLNRMLEHLHEIAAAEVAGDPALRHRQAEPAPAIPGGSGGPAVGALTGDRVRNAALTDPVFAADLQELVNLLAAAARRRPPLTVSVVAFGDRTVSLGPPEPGIPLPT